MNDIIAFQNSILISVHCVGESVYFRIGKEIELKFCIFKNSKENFTYWFLENLPAT